MDDSELIRETINCWTPYTGHDLDYVEESAHIVDMQVSL